MADFDEIANSFDISKEQIKLIEEKAKRKLQNRMGAYYYLYEEIRATENKTEKNTKCLVGIKILLEEITAILKHELSASVQNDKSLEQITKKLKNITYTANTISDQFIRPKKHKYIRFKEKNTKIKWWEYWNTICSSLKETKKEIKVFKKKMLAVKAWNKDSKLHYFLKQIEDTTLNALKEGILEHKKPFWSEVESEPSIITKKELKRRIDTLLKITIEYNWDYYQDKQTCLEYLLFAANSWKLKRDAYPIADILLNEAMQSTEFLGFEEPTLLPLKKLGKKQKSNRIIRIKARKEHLRKEEEKRQRKDDKDEDYSYEDLRNEENPLSWRLGNCICCIPLSECSKTVNEHGHNIREEHSNKIEKWLIALEKAEQTGTLAGDYKPVLEDVLACPAEYTKWQGLSLITMVLGDEQLWNDAFLIIQHMRTFLQERGLVATQDPHGLWNHGPTHLISCCEIKSEEDVLVAEKIVNELSFFAEDSHRLIHDVVKFYLHRGDTPNAALWLLKANKEDAIFIAIQVLFWPYKNAMKNLMKKISLNYFDILLETLRKPAYAFSQRT